MTIRPDHWIARMAVERDMIAPFVAEKVRSRAVEQTFTLTDPAQSLYECSRCKKQFQTNGTPLSDHRCIEVIERVVSYGLTSFGYDLRVADEFKVFTPVNCTVIDPKNLSEDCFVTKTGQGHVIIPPNSFALAYSVERFKIPQDVLALVLGKSTYARCGIVVNVTPLEPCLSEDSEVLTSDGWLPMADVKVGDLVLTRREDGVAEYRAVERKQEREYRGDMLHFAGRSVDQLVTPDHKLFVWRRNSRQNSYEGMTIEAREVFGKHNYSFDRAVEWFLPEEASSAPFAINGAEFPQDPFLRFLGCWLGDGSAYRAQDGGYMVKLAAVTKERKFAYYETVLQELGIDNAVRHDRGWRFYNKALCQYLMQFGHAAEKFVDRRWLSLPAAKLGLILDGLIESDGNRDTMTFTTTSRRLADDAQEIVFKAGSAAIVREVEEEIRGYRFTAYKVRVCDTHLSPKMPPRNHKLVSYNGMVYDVTVPNHVFFMRRNGKASWTGNCWEGHVTLEISNTTPLPAKVYADEGLCQVVFFQSEEPCTTPYGDGKYQNQAAAVVLPKV